MRKFFIISGIMFSFLAVQNTKAQYANTAAQAGDYQSVSQTNTKQTKKSDNSVKGDFKEKMKAEKPKFNDFMKETGEEADIFNASDTKENIVIEEFYKDGSVPEKYANYIRSYIVSAVENRGRLVVIDPETVSMGGREHKKIEYFGNEKFKDNERFDALAEAGVRYVISGKITDYDTNEYHNAKGKVFHECTITVCFTAYDLKEREVLMTHNEIAAVHGFNTSTKANEKLIEGFKQDYANFIDNSFKLRTGLKEVGKTTKNDVIKGCLINAGSSLGVKSNDNFDVYVKSSDKSGEEWNKLGRVKATKKIYSGFSECNVVSGAKKISGALEAGAELVFVSDDNSLIF